MKCVRCSEDTARKLVEAPDGSKSWEVYHCSTCNFVWRSSESPRVIDPAKRPPVFQYTKEELEILPTTIPITPHRK